MKKKLKVGFDLDGVILYNPVRIFRSLAKTFLKPLKKTFFRQEKEPFYIPKTDFEKYVWGLIHKSSFRINTGYRDLKKMARDDNFSFYLITGRYGYLKKDYLDWLKKIDSRNVFRKCFINEKSIQPDLFKKTMIQKLDLDYYVEDNFDIVEKLKSQKKADILWITNLADRNINYPYKFSGLKEVCLFLRKRILPEETLKKQHTP